MPESITLPPPVLLVTDSLAINGAVRITVQLAARWSEAARLAVVQTRSGVPVVAVPESVPMVPLLPADARLRTGLPAALTRLVRAARRAEVVVPGSEIGIGLVLAAAAARLARRPLIIAVHADLDDALDEWMPPRVHGLLRRIHRAAAGAVCVTPGLVEPLVRNGLSPDRIRVVVNGIDLAGVAAAGAQPADPTVLPDHGRPVVVATGRLASQKGLDLLIRAHARVVDTHPHDVLLLNDGPEEQTLRALVAELGVTGTVHFHGAVAQPLPIVRSADLFCLPSRHEGLPLALLEALALGTPTLSADCSEGVRAALDGGRVGGLIPVDDVDALAAALAAHLGDPGPLRERAQAGLTHVRGFDSSVMADGWATALHTLVGSTR